MYDVALARYERPLESLRETLDLIDGLRGIGSGSRVVIKPNLVMWLDGMNFPKYGVLTTARLMEDMVLLLAEHGVRDITIAEGPTESGKESLLQLAAAGMGLDSLTRRFGVRVVNVLDGPFVRVPVDGVSFMVHQETLEADHLINMPVLKTHMQVMVSLGMKNLKGLLDVSSRKRCHNPNPSIDLDYHVSKLAGALSPTLTVIDGIYSLERGPLCFGDARRTDLIIASRDPVSADKVGAAVLGIPPQIVPHISMAASERGRASDLSDVDIKGGLDVEAVAVPHVWEQEDGNATGTVHVLLGIWPVTGLTYSRVDSTLCTYCAGFMRRYVELGLMLARNGSAFDDIEILFGKVQQPEGGHKHTLLVGQCQVAKNARDARVNHAVTIGGCPPSEADFYKAFDELGIQLPEDFMGEVQKAGEAFLMGRYAGRPEFSEEFYRVSDVPAPLPVCAGMHVR